MSFSKRMLMYETNSKTEYTDYGEIVSIINDKLVNVNMGGQRDTDGQLVILEAVLIESSYIPQIGDWVGIEWRSGIPVAIGGGNSNSAGLKNINDNVMIVSQTSIANGVINSDHIRTDTIEARHIVSDSIQSQHISANSINSQHIQSSSISGGHIIGDSIEAKHLSVSAREFGLLAQYYTHTGGTNKFEVFKTSRIESVINFDWMAGSPDVVGQADNFAIRFQGLIFAPQAGIYTFHLTSDDGSKLWVNDTVVVDSWSSSTTGKSGTISLTKDTWVTIRLDYFENTSNAKLKLEWTTPSGAREVIPSRYMTSTQTVIDGGTILTNTITASNMKVGTITASSGIIADAAIGSAHIISGNILSAHIANAQIKSAHIASANILSAHIASANITNAHIVDLNASKINAGFISSERIAANSISGNQIAANTIDGDRIIGNSIEANKIKAGSITSMQIGANQITANEIKAGAITGDKIRAQSITAEHISARGIDVSDSIMIYNSVTGETLIGGGFLRVEGLDVGVVQSDNLLGNGLFLNASSSFGILKDNPVGETMLGAKNNEIGAHQIWKYDLATGAKITTIDILGKKPVGVAIDEDDKYAYVTVQGDDTLAQINIVNDFVTSTTLKMGKGPAEIKYFGVGLGDHKHFFVLNTDELDHRVPDSLIVVDAPPASINSELYVHHEIPLGNTPYDMVLDDRKWMYVTLAGQGDIAVLDITSDRSMDWRAIGSIPIAATGTDNYHGGLPSTFGLGVVIGGDAAGQYDADGAASSTGSAHQHGGYGSSTGTAKLYEPRGIAQSADSATLYVVDNANNELVVVDKFGKAPYNHMTGIDETTGNMGEHSGHTSTPSGNVSPAQGRGNLSEGGGPRTPWVRYRINVGDRPERVAVMNGKIFITLQGSGQVAIIDEQAILNEIALDRAFYTPDWTVLSPMRTVNDFTVRTVTVGSRPTRMTLSPATGKILISLTGQDKIAYFDANTETVTNTIATGSNPMGLAVTNDGRYLYVANNGGGGDLSFIYPKGPFIGDPYVGLEGMVEYQGAEFWTPYRTDWVKENGKIIASSSVEFRVNEPFLNEGGYAALRVQGKRFQEAWIEQDIFNVENYSNGNNVINTIGEKLYSISGNQARWYPQADWLQSPLPVFYKVQELSGGTLSKTLLPTNAYTVQYDSPAYVNLVTPLASGNNWVEANYTTRNNLWYRPHNGSVLIAQENSSSDNFKTEFQLEEFVPKFVVFDNQQTSPFTPIEDGINEEYLGLEYSTMTNRAKGKPVTASATPVSGSLALITDDLQVDEVAGDHTGMDMFPVQPFVTLPAGLQHVKIDLGATYMIGKISVAHSYEEDRVYQGTKTEVSEDGIVWTTVYDSAVSGLYSEKPAYHSLHGHTHYSKIITFPAKPVRYVRDWANGYKVAGTGALITANHWTDIKAYGDWEFEKGYTYESGEHEGTQIATNGKGIVTTDIYKAYIAADVQIEFTSWWYMTYIVGPEFGTLAIEMPTLMNSNHILSLTNEYNNKVAHRHVMSFPPSTTVVANEKSGAKAGKHRAIIRQDSGKISLDRLRFEDFQFYKTNPQQINGATTTFQRYKTVAEQAKWYQGKGRQSTFGPYDTPRTNPDSGLPDHSVPIKYRFRVKAYLNSDNVKEERGVAYITSAIVETGKQSTHWRPSAASDSVAASKLESWDSNQPHKTGIQTRHIANGAIRGAKILPYAIMDYHISPYARIEENKLNLRYPTHGHVNKSFLDSLTGFIGSGGVYGTGNAVARADHEHPYLGISGTAINAAKLNNLTSSQFLRSDTSGTLNGALAVNSTLGVTGNTTLRGTVNIIGATTTTGITVNGNIVVTGTVDGVDVAALSSSVISHIGSGDTAHAVAVANGSAGFISGYDQGKLNTIAISANNYAHPATHPASIIVQDSGNRFVTDADKTNWNSKTTLALGESSTTAYRGDRGKSAYDHISEIENAHSQTVSASVPSAGWFRVAQLSSSAGRGDAIFSIFTTGGSYTPQTLIIKYHGDWSTGSTLIVDALTGLNYWSNVRVVNDAGNYFIEVYFKSAIAFSMQKSATAGYNAVTTLKSGVLTGGTIGTVLSQVDAVVGINTSQFVQSQGFYIGANRKDLEWDAAYTHSESAHAPINAQKNSDITRLEIEAKLTGSVYSHAHPLATSGTSGFMSGSDFARLGNMQDNAINQITADSRYLQLVGGSVTGSLKVGVDNSYIGIDNTGVRLAMYKKSTLPPAMAVVSGGVFNVLEMGTNDLSSSISSTAVLRTLLSVSASSITYNGNAVWHNGNFIPSNYYNKTETNSLIATAGNIKAEIANVFTYAGTAIKIQPSANIANAKLFQMNNSSGVELVSMDNEGDIIVKGNLTVQGTTQYAGTTTVQGDYTITGALGVSGNAVLNTATVTTLTIPANGVIKELGKENEVMRFPIYGIGGDMQFQSDATVFEKIVSHYNTFDTTYAMPSIPNGATRKYKCLISYSTSSSNNCTFRAVQLGTTTEIMSFTLLGLTGAVDGTVRTILSPAFTTSYLGHIDIQAKNDTAGNLVIKYIEVIAYDVY